MISDKKSINYCEGCGNENYCDYKSLNRILGPDGLCPCTDCIIKMMCEKECDDYKYWLNPINIRFRKKMKRKE